MKTETLDAMRVHALESYPNESAGLVVVIKGREQYVRCRNIDADPANSFTISGQEFASVDDRGEILAVVHSHPDEAALFTAADRVQCEGHKLPYYVVSVLRDPADGTLAIGGINSMEPSGYLAPLVGRPFHHGVLDCYTLIQDWYFRERGIVLPYFERPDNWWDDGHSQLYLDHFRDAGFEVTDKPLEVGDVFLMQIRSGNDTPNHAGVYIGDDLMLHHMIGRLSSRDVYGGYWREVTRMRVRYAGPSAAPKG